MEKPRILIIDDDPGIIELVRSGLARGFEVESAEDAATAREALEGGAFELVLCDWILPDANGDKLLAWAKQQPALSRIPFVMVTARDDKEFVVTAIRLGADGYLIKPFSLERLRTKVHSLLEKRPTATEASWGVTLHYRNHEIGGTLRRLEGDTLVVALSRNKFPPQIFEEVGLQLASGEGPCGGCPQGRVLRLQAEALAPEAESVEVHILLEELNDQHRAKLEQLREALAGATP